MHSRKLLLGALSVAALLISYGCTPTPSSPSSSSSSTSEQPKEKVLRTQVVTYPGPSILTSSTKARVFVNDQELFVYETRVNNQRVFTWDTPTTYSPVAYFDFEGRVNVRIEVPDDVNSSQVSPLAYDIQTQNSGKTISFSIDQPNNYVIEYNGDSQSAINLFANPLEEDVPDKDDPDVVYIGPGIYDAGAIPLNAGQTLYIAGGAYVYGYVRTELLDNIAIRGRGIISGEIYQRRSEGEVTVPLEFRKGKNISVEGIALLDPAGWATTIYDCDGVTFDNVKVITARANGDGISVQGSSNVTIKKGFVRTWDDSLVVKNNDGYSTENVLFDGVNVWTDLAQSMEIGYETNGDYIRNVTFRNITVFHNFHKAVMSIHNADRADVSNVLYQNITVEDGQMNGDTPTDGTDDFFIDNSILYSIEWSKNTDLGNISDVTYDNIKVDKIVDTASARLQGYAGNNATVSGVTFRDLDLAGTTVSKAEDMKLNQGSLVSNVVFKNSGSPITGALPNSEYDLSELDSSDNTITVVPGVSQEAVMVPEFAWLKGDLNYLGQPVDLSVSDARVTHGAGTSYDSPEDDGSGDFGTAENPVANLLDGSNQTFMQSKEYLEQTNEFIAVTLDFDEEAFLGTIRLIGDYDSAAVFNYSIELRVRTKRSDGTLTAYNKLNTGNYSLTPASGNAIDISFSSMAVWGIQLRFFKASDSHFRRNYLKFAELLAYGPSLAYKKPIVDSTPYNDVYPASKLTDGEPDGTSYYESASLPAFAVIDLQSVYNVKTIVLRLPAALTWTTRTEEIELLTSNQNATYSATGTTFTSFWARQPVTFDPSTGNSKIITLDSPISMRFLKVVIYSNDIAAGYNAQLSEVMLFE